MNFLYDILNTIACIIFGSPVTDTVSEGYCGRPKGENVETAVLTPKQNIIKSYVEKSPTCISIIPSYTENIAFFTIHQGLGNYMFFTSQVTSPLIKIELRRLSQSYVGVLIGEREVIWDIAEGAIYTDEAQDIMYWDDAYMPLTVYGVDEFYVKRGEILAVG